MTLTSVNIKQIAEQNPDQLYRISPAYFGDGQARICKYSKSERSITEFKDVESGQVIDVLRGNMKYVSLFINY